MTTLQCPENRPDPGFYYHYKHDPSGLVENYAYQVLNVASRTEEHGKFDVIYRPLYLEATVYQAGRLWDSRPIDMWVGDVVKNGASMPRFKKITDPTVLEELYRIKFVMYGSK